MQSTDTHPCQETSLVLAPRPCSLPTQVDLKLVGALDVAECLREAAQMPGPTTRRPPPDEEQPEGSPAPAGVLPPPPAPPATSGAAALAVLDLVTRAGVAWDVASVRTGGGSYVSYKQEDASGPVKGLLPMKVSMNMGVESRHAADPDTARLEQLWLRQPRPPRGSPPLECVSQLLHTGSNVLWAAA